MRTSPRLIVFFCLGGLLAALLGWQRRETQGLREMIQRGRERLDECHRLEAENRRLLAAQPSDAAMELLVSRLIWAEQLRAQIAALRQREDAGNRLLAAQSAPDARPSLSLKSGPISVSNWRNVGQGSPEAAFETALWAAAHGELDTLAGLLAFDAVARQEAATLFDRLPAANRAELATPERMVALLTAMDVPLGRAEILREGSTADGIGTKLTAQLTDPAGLVTMAAFRLKPDGRGWHLQVPVAAVRKYADLWNGTR